jgi:transcriptional regulator with XRE-family HTH domain
MTLGENIRSIRKNQCMIIQKMSELTGLSKSTISEVERDLSSPTISTLTKIADALNIKTSTLLQLLE